MIVGAALVLAVAQARPLYYAAVGNYSYLQFTAASLAGSRKDLTVDLRNRVLGSVINRPEDQSLNRLAGLYLFATDEYTGAIKYYLRTQSGNPHDVMGLYWLGKAYERIGDYANALIAMYQARNLEYFPVIPDSMSRTSLEHLVRGLAGHPLSARAYFELGKLIYSVDAKQSRVYFDLAFLEAPIDLRFSLDAAWFLYDQGDLESARVFAERAQSRFPEDPWVYVFWGTFHQATGHTDLAIQNLEWVIKRFPVGDISSVAHIGLGQIYISRGEYATAIEHLDSANRLQTGQWDVYLELSRAHSELHQCAPAREFLQMASPLIKTDRQRSIYMYFEAIVLRECPQP